ncbi:hypothetical protein DFH06DRAFT_1129738 [Mycena polygramma]|nr:hypothetical protein DFH06DRAFT_1129738 [Mycena polygramma]
MPPVAHIAALPGTCSESRWRAYEFTAAVEASAPESPDGTVERRDHRVKCFPGEGAAISVDPKARDGWGRAHGRRQRAGGSWTWRREQGGDSIARAACCSLTGLLLFASQTLLQPGGSLTSRIIPELAPGLLNNGMGKYLALVALALFFKLQLLPSTLPVPSVERRRTPATSSCILASGILNPHTLNSNPRHDILNLKGNRLSNSHSNTGNSKLIGPDIVYYAQISPAHRATPVRPTDVFFFADSRSIASWKNT